MIGRQQLVVVLRIEAGDEAVGVRHRDHRHEPRRIADVEAVVETNLRNEPCACCTGASAQNRAATVCSAVRLVLVLDPSSFTSL